MDPFAFLDWLPEWLAVAVLAFNPVGEVRLAVPVAMLRYDMGWGEAFVWSLLGNLVVLPAAAWLYPRLETLLRRIGWVARLLDRIEAKTRDKEGAKIKRWKEMAIAIIIAVPVPGSGAWTGALVAHFFGYSPRQILGPFYAGVVGATALATVVVATGNWAFPFFYG